MKDELAKITAEHPCYADDARHTHARMHLPVAPVCNISCNYCNRKYDCVNESRPGVTSEVLTPELALAKFVRVKEALPKLRVAGIAGPGDALANWENVKHTLSLIRQTAPETIVCLSTNGLLLPHCGQDIINLGIQHVTVTVNCLEPALGAKIYHHIHYQGKYYVGENAAEILIENQMAGIRLLATAGVLVKVNIVMLEDLNAAQIPDVVKKVKQLGAFMTNIMPLIPAPGSTFQALPRTSMQTVNAMRDLCQADLPQMRHCQQCRADAIGLLHEDQAAKFRNIQPGAAQKFALRLQKYKVAVTSRHKKLVDLHFGHAEEFHIYETNGISCRFIETRATPKYCTGTADCAETAQIKEQALAGIADCAAVVTMRIGYEAKMRVGEQGIAVVEACYSVEEGVLQAFHQLRHEAELAATGQRAI